MRNGMIILIIVIGLAGAGGGYLYYSGAIKLPLGGDASQSQGADARPPMEVATLVLETQSIKLAHVLPGRISAARQSQVRPQVDGIITERLFEEGAQVEKGQQLYQIDSARYQAALASAEADLKSAKSNSKFVEARTRRYESLVRTGAVSQQDFEDVKIQLEQSRAEEAVAQAAVDVAKVNLSYTKVYAPISGRIGRSLVTEGALVTANQVQSLTVITQLDPVYVDMQQSGVETMKLQNFVSGQSSIPVTLSMGDQEDLTYPHEGQLKFSEVTVDQTTGSVTLRAIVPNPNGVLLPGLFVRATMNLGQQEVVLVPQRATTRTPEGKLTVWLVDKENHARPTAISVSSAHGDSWVVNDGVVAGDTIIVSGYQKLGAGAAVTTTPWQHKTQE